MAVKLILGTVQFGLPYGIANTSGQPSYRSVCDILSAAAAGGIDMLDTAADYGESEAVLGRALAELGLRGRMTVVSKIEHLPGNLTAAEARKRIGGSLERSLRRLKLERLPIGLFHEEGNLCYREILQEFVAAGLVGAAGVSLDEKVVPAVAGAACVQIPCNILDRRFNRLLAEAPAPQMIFARSVYLQGLLLMPEEKIPDGLREIIPLRRRLDQLAGAAGMPPRELYFRYLLSQNGLSGILIGVDSPAQLEENLRLASAGPLPEDLLAAIRQMVPVLAERLVRPHCWAA